MRIEYGVYENLIIIYPKPYSIYFRGARVYSGMNRHGSPWMVVLVESEPGRIRARSLQLRNRIDA